MKATENHVAQEEFLFLFFLLFFVFVVVIVFSHL